MPKIRFTLVELLTVIAIVSILAVLLLPALGQSRLKAHATACRGNLRQIGIALGNYFTDSGDLLPFGYISCRSRPDGNRSFLHALYPYLAGGDFPDDGELHDPAPYRCPEGRYAHLYGRLIASYGHNRPADLWGYHGGLSACPARKVALLRTPSRTFAAADGRLDINEERWSAGTDYPNPAPDCDPEEVVEERHRGRVNLLYFDLHAGDRDVRRLKIADDREFWIGR